MTVTDTEQAALDRMVDALSVDDIATAFDAYRSLCALASDFGVDNPTDLVASILVIAEQHPDYPTFQAQFGGGFRA